MRVSSFEAARRLAYKELLDGVRHRAGYVTMGMFALTVIAFMSMSLAGSMADGRLTAALLWVVIFFAATLQGERLFAEEAVRRAHSSFCGYMFPRRRCSLARWRRILLRCLSSP